jgi:hypothetical protein
MPAFAESLSNQMFSRGLLLEDEWYGKRPVVVLLRTMVLNQGEILADDIQEVARTEQIEASELLAVCSYFFSSGIVQASAGPAGIIFHFPSPLHKWWAII